MAQELKARTARSIANEEEMLEMGSGESIEQMLVYPKSEADKVIAELKNEIEEQKRLRNMALASVPNALKVMKIIQRQKYKRCLAMAKWCEAQVEWYNSLNEDYSFWLELYVKWHKRWLALANKFKLNRE